MSGRSRPFAGAACAVLWLACFAAAAAPAQGFRPATPKPTDKQAAEMDYGPYLSTTLGVGPDNGVGNVTPKGLVVRLDAAKQAHLCFDTELLRVSAAWAGERFNMQGRAFANDSDTFSFLDRPPQFATPPVPGWASGDLREDPRRPKDGPLPADWAKYKGLYLHGERVVLSYTVGTTAVLELPGVDAVGDAVVFTRTLGVAATDRPMAMLAFEAPEHPDVAVVEMGERVAAVRSDGAVTVARVDGGPPGTAWEVAGRRVYLRLPALAAPVSFRVAIARLTGEQAAGFAGAAGGPVEDPRALTKGGPGRWPQSVTTRGSVASGPGPYVIDSIGIPDRNPYRSWIRFTGMDFFPDGKSAALCTWNGDVWVVSGIDATLERLTWRRFASGLRQPMGLKVVDGVVHTAGRDQITRLHDLDGDGEADFYENFNNDVTLTTNFHEMVFDLQTDPAGNFYFTKGSAIWAGEQRRAAHNGTFLKLSRDGSKLEVLATGLRAPNGVGVGPAGELTCSDNQGNWTPTSCINLIRRGAFYGFHHPGEQPRPNREPPLVWIPHAMDRSPGTQLWVPEDDRWGPLRGSMIETSYDTSVLVVPFERIGRAGDGGAAGAQGGVVKLPLKFASGVMRGRFNPADGQLYVCGLRGWSSGAAADACFDRVRYTGAPVYLPHAVRTRRGGLDVTFTAPLARDSADPDNVGAECYNVVRTEAYGSGERSPADPTRDGHDPVEITAASLSADGLTLSLEMPGLRPVTNLLLKFNLDAADGTAFSTEMSYTVNALPE